MRAPTRRIRKAREAAVALCWLALPLAMIALFCVYPAVMAVYRSFTDWTPASSTWVGFENYKELFADKVFDRSLLNMVILVFFSLLTTNIATLLLAELLFNMRELPSKIFRYLFLIPSLVPGMVSVLLWKNVILSGGEEGLFNTILGWFGVPPNAWYFSERMSKFSIIITNFPWVGGINFLIYLAGLQNIPESCLEAARLDGVTTWQRVRYIDLPLLVNQIKYFFIVGVVGGVQTFDMQLIVTNGGPNYSTTVPAYLLYQNTYGYSQLGRASAIGVLLFAIAFSLTLLANRLAKRGDANA